MQTIIAAFDDRQSAQRAADSLTQQGFSSDAVHVQSGYDADLSSSPTSGGHAGSEHEGFFAKVGDFFSNLFGDDESAGKYAESVRRGGTVVVVDAATDDEFETAHSLLSGAGSVDVEERAERWRNDGWTGFDASARPFSGEELAVERQTVLPVVQEELAVGKREVETGGIRVVKRLTETPVSEMIRLRQERATIERRPVDRAATEADFANFKEGTIEVRETAEEAVVSKTARVVEEVVVGKEVTERSETVTDTVRRADVEVERLTGVETERVAGLRGSTTSTTSTTTGTTPGTLGTSGTYEP